MADALVTERMRVSSVSEIERPYASINDEFNIGMQARLNSRQRREYAWRVCFSSVLAARQACSLVVDVETTQQAQQFVVGKQYDVIVKEVG